MSADSIHRYLVAYDIASDLRRNRIAHALESYGDRIQYSVFIVDANPAKLVRLKAELRKRMNVIEDRALICNLGPLSSRSYRAMEFMGDPPRVTSDGPLVI